MDAKTQQTLEQIAAETFARDFDGTGFSREEIQRDIIVMQESDRQQYQVVKKWSKGARQALLHRGNVNAINRFLRVFQGLEVPYAYQKAYANFAVFCGAFRMIETGNGKSTYREFAPDMALVEPGEGGLFKSTWTKAKAEFCQRQLEAVPSEHLFKVQWRQPKKAQSLKQELARVEAAALRLRKLWDKTAPEAEDYKTAQALLTLMSALYPDLAPMSATQRRKVMAEEILAAEAECEAEAEESDEDAA